VLFSFKGQDLFYGKKTVLKNLKIEIESGEQVAIIGESGSGKSTLLKAMREQQAMNLAWCPQQPGLVPILNNLHNIYMGQLEQHHFLSNLKQLVMPSKKIKNEISKVAQELGVVEQLYQSSEEISGGQQQRVSIARAIYSKKKIFLGDEPVSALDEYQSADVLKHLSEKFETMIIALHDVDLARQFCKRIIALKDGSVFFDKKNEDIKETDLEQVYKV
jgi:phosphonate transport system ATP-binding protein